jgi:hypothetical protein
MVENSPQPDPEAPAPQAEMPASERAKAPDLKKPSGPRRILFSLFNPETRSGRFTRRLLRTLALIVGSFALGVLATYLLLYRPASQQLTDTRRQATQAGGDLQQANQTLTQARQDLQSAKSQAGQAQTKLEVELARSQVLRSMNALTQAQMAIQANNKAGAVKALDTARGYIQAVQPLLEKRDAQQASTLQALFTLAKNDIDRDLKLASQDLERLQSELERAEANILQ